MGYHLTEAKKNSLVSCIRISALFTLDFIQNSVDNNEWNVYICIRCLRMSQISN